MRRLLLAAILIFGLSAPSFAAHYWVSYTDGNDANNGTTNATPFKHVPQGAVNNCASNCALVVLAADDIVTLKGNDTWPYPNVVGIYRSGTSGHPITYTVDATWYRGGAWSRPKFDMQYLTSINWVLDSGVHDIVITGLELTGMSNSSASNALANADGAISGSNVCRIAMSNLYVHDWRLTGSGARYDGTHGGLMFASLSAGCYDTISLADSIIENSANTGSGTQSGLATKYIYSITNTTIHDVASASLQTCNWNGGEVYNVGYPSGNVSPGLGYNDGAGYTGAHPNSLYVDPGAFFVDECTVNGMNLHDMDGGVEGLILALVVNQKLITMTNNIIYGHMPPSLPIALDTFTMFGELGGSAYIANNLVYMPDNGNSLTNVFNCPPAIASDRPKMTDFTSYNNYVIGNGITQDNCSSANVTGTIIRSNNLPNSNAGQDPSTATAQGYVQATLWAPINGSGSTLSAAADLSAVFTTDFLGNTKTPGYWDIGPYQYQGANYYVSTATNTPAGNDSNAGTIAAPFLTIEKCISTTVLTRRDTCNVRAGNYRAAAVNGYKINADLVNTAANWNDKLTLKAYNGEAVSFTAPGYHEGQVIGFATVSPFITPQDLYWKVDGISIRGDGSLDHVPTINYPIGGNLGNHVWLANMEVSYGYGSGILPSGSDSWIVENLNVHHNGQTEQDHGIYWDGSDGLIDGGTYHDNSGYGIQEFHSTGCIDGVTDCTNDNTIRNVSIYNNATAGSGGNLVLSTGFRNSAYNNALYGSGSGREVDIEYRCADCTFYNNTVIPGPGKSGIVVESSVTNLTIKGNILFTSGGGTPVVDGGTGTTDSNNLKATDPTFVNGTNHDYRLQSTSVARVANGFSGANLYSIVGLRTDKGGIARANSAFDAGAYTYDSAPVCTPSKVVFTSQPTGTNIGASLGTISVAIQDSGSNTCTTYSSTITLSKHASTCTGMTLNGTVSGAASSGVFTTTNANMTGNSGACSLDAASSGLTGATSNSFTIADGSFVLSTSSGTQGQTINISMIGTGTSWANGTTAATFSGLGITVNSTTCAATNVCTANITISSSAATGFRDVTMTTNAEIEVASSAFNVLATPTAGNGGGYRLRVRIR